MATAKKKVAKPAAPARKAAPAKKAAPTVKAKPAAAAPKAEKPKKPKLVRDSFTIPKLEYKVLQDSKDRAAALGRPVKKSEVLRAGLKALAGMNDTAFVAALGAVPALKTGRPAKT
ncbi:hypothetical protein [Caenimonas soli]|uniref:hypothetical protein n=1 Tax=Caenimonas soli TaxID=2735555 RepID=UPI001554F50A|nr:hypothetical protein [Caenimonas soli]NPC54446.1 hypothetical protein [Caenimonas soli]